MLRFFPEDFRGEVGERPLKPGIVFAVVIACCLLISSCGSGSSSPVPQGSLANGNWYITASSAVVPANSLTMDASLGQDSSGIAVDLHIDNSTCFDFANDLVTLTGVFTGTGGSLVLTSAPVRSQVITVTADGSGSSFTGSYSITGGCAGGDHGAITATFVPPVSGTWIASFASGSTTTTITATLLQASVADINGRFPLTGTLAFSGSPCSTGGTVIYPSALGDVSSVSGNSVSVVATTNDIGGGSGSLAFTGTLPNPSTATYATGGYVVLSGLCGGESFNVQFNKQ